MLRNQTRLLRLKLALISLFGLWIGCTVYGPAVQAFSSGPPASRTGAPALGTFPAEPTCVDCHTTFALNSGPGTLSLSGLPAGGYTPNQEITVTVRLMQTNRLRYGFEVTALDDQGLKAGDLVVTDSTRTQLVFGFGSFAGRQYIEHRFAGVTPNGTDENSWSFTWHAPSQSVGRVTVYVAGNAANGNGSSSGDYIYTQSASIFPAIQPTGLQFYPLASPVRLLDTRQGASPNACSQPNAPINGGTARLQTGRNFCTIPANAVALTGNVTTVNSGGGFLTLYPSDATRPTVASTNYGPNEIVNNVFTVGLGAGDGAFRIFAFTTTDVVVDVTGYYAPPGTGGLYFHPLPAPVRLLETRQGFNGCVTPGTPLIGGAESTQQAISACTGIPAAARAIVGNATTVGPQGGGFLTIFPADATRPLVASSNYNPNQVVNGPFAVGLAPNGQFKIYTFATTDLVVDVLGYYSTEANDANGAGLLFTPLAHPVRLLETRAGQPVGCFKPGAPLNGNQEYTQTARGTCDGVNIPTNALGVVGNATGVFPQGAGFLTLWPSGVNRPLVATANYNGGDIGNRHFIVGLGNADGAFKLYSFATTDLVIDLAGYFAP